MRIVLVITASCLTIIGVFYILLQHPTLDIHQPVSEIPIKDTVLRACLLNTAAQKQWKQVGEVNALQCNNLNGAPPIGSANGIQMLSNLQVLDLAFNEIVDVVPIMQLPRLERLNLGHNHIQVIPPSGFVSNSLREIKLDHNRLNMVDWVGYNNLTHLETLSLSHNQIQSLPNLANVHALKTLNLNGNLLSEIMPLKQSSSLEYLDLGANNISNITALATLEHLRVLQLDHNPIQTIDALQLLYTLQELNLDYTAVESLTLTQQLTDLEQISIVATPIESLEPLLALSNLQHIRAGENSLLNCEHIAHIQRQAQNENFIITLDCPAQ